MRYFLVLSLSLILITGCASKEAEQVKNNDNNMAKEKSAPKIIDKADPNQFVDLISQYSQAIIKTNLGDIKVKFYNEDAPKTVNNFLNLAQLWLYNGTKFHRIIKDFMIQGGDPNSRDNDWANDGAGGPGYTFEDEINSHKLIKGSLAMANSGTNTNGSQFFIVTAQETPWLNGHHTNFGEVVEGLDVVVQIENAETNDRDHPLKDFTIEEIELVK